MIYRESCDLVLIGCAYMPCQYHSDNIQGSGVAASSNTSLRSTSIIRFISIVIPLISAVMSRSWATPTIKDKYLNTSPECNIAAPILLSL